jgi:hypothetical protein
MTTPDDQPRVLRAAMRSWRRRSDSVAHERDSLVLACLEAGITKEEIHQAMGLGRSTIDRIEKREDS